MGGSSSKPDEADVLYILVMGMTGSGKTSFINRASGSNLKISDDIESCTLEDQLSNPFKFKGRTIRMIDTIGFEDTQKTDAELNLEMRIRLMNLGQIKRQLVGVIYMHDITETRVGNSRIRMIKNFKKVIGRTAVENVVIVTTKWDLVDPAIGNRRNEQLANHPKVFAPLLRQGIPMIKYHHKQSPSEIIQKVIDGS